ncbi:unnamed protein product [Paramecium primaurelia]|uniref:Uncharacterized protein n=1 Tax=Paramecium primaurelia TaxID=5886 RepID=A0A8S1KCG9_PARPR|nr:unnamed protein product [Paramecium primaurelia]
MQIKYQYIIIKSGGGSYDYQGESNGENKIGKWVEPSEFFPNLCQITYNGQFKRGERIGKWDIMYRRMNLNGYTGGGVNNQTITIGKYQYGIKVGNWDNWQFKSLVSIQKEKIGGDYRVNERDDQIISEIKEGRWIELSERFNDSNQVTYVSEYQSGVQIGIWCTFMNWNEINQHIGGENTKLEKYMIKLFAQIKYNSGLNQVISFKYVGLKKE